MKNNIVFILLFLLLSGCDSLLKTESDEKLSGDDFWYDASASQVESFVNSMYYFFREATMQDAAYILYSGDLRCAPIEATNTSTTYNYVGYLATNDLNDLVSKYTGVQGGAITSWKTFYKVVQSANILIANVDMASISDLEKKMYQAEGIFMRDLTYFFLVRNFGDVPYYTTANNSVSLPRTNMVTVLQNISTELQTLLNDDPNAEILPWVQAESSKKATHASRGAVLALLMHVNMWLAGFDSENATQYYQKVTQCGEGLVDNNGGAYELLPLSQSTTIFRGGSSEGIFEISQNINYSNTGEVFDQNAIYANQVMYTPFTGRARPYIQYTYEFLSKVYPPETTDGRVTAWFDKNIYSTLSTDTKEITKFKNVDTYSGSSVTANSGNQIVFRMADAILLYAEALANLGTDDTKACELLNRIRTRAGAPEVTASGSMLQDDIYWERVRELIGEGHYFYDLVRTKKVCNSNYCYHPLTKGNFDAGAWTWPISRDALENNTQMQLNTYWE